jgi:hypothetical protein
MAHVKHKGEAPLTVKVRILLSPMQHEAVTARAKELDLTVADYFRSIAKTDVLQHPHLVWPENTPFYEDTK